MWGDSKVSGAKLRESLGQVFIGAAPFVPLPWQSGSMSRLPGLSPDLQSMEQIRRIMRPTDVPDQGLLCDLLWSDPDKDVQGWGENDRGVSFTFGSEVVAKFLHKHDLDLICRAHQVGALWIRSHDGDSGIHSWGVQGQT